MTYPTTEIVLCRNVPLDNSYDHELTFVDQQAQATYFYSKAYRTLQLNTYQRVMMNKLRIQCSIGDAMACNYLFFSNNSHEGKTVYAFITGWEYVNDVTTEITYEIDAFQTFWFDLDIKSAFVEREHSLTDVIGANTIPENLEAGEYKLMGSSELAPYAASGIVDVNACAIFYCTFDGNFQPFKGDFCNYVYSGLYAHICTTVAQVQTFMENAMAAEGGLAGIVAGFMCPWTPQTKNNIQWTRQVTKQYASIDGYVPKNKKLFTAPYYILRIRNDADMAEYKFEWFSGNTCDFNLIGCILPEPTLTIYPTNYLEYGTGGRLDLRQVSSKYPQIALGEDAYKVYIAQNSSSIYTQFLGRTTETALSVIKNAFSGNLSNYLKDVGSWVGQNQNTLAQLEDMKFRPTQLNGAQTSLSDYSIGAKKFYADILSIKAEYARIIDDFFSMYGYATHRVKKPNITGRPYWNYVKTQGIVLDIANAPQPYIKTVIDAFNRGITFWHNPANVGNYALDNSPQI